jgi:hypothetical protein
MQEEIRQLRLRREGDRAPGPWLPLGYYLTPHWRGLQNIPGIKFGTDDDFNDLSHDHCPRYYIDRDRVYLGGCVEFDAARVTEAAVYGLPGDESSSYVAGITAILQNLPAAASSERPMHDRLVENLNFSETGWIGDWCGVYSNDRAGLYVLQGTVDDNVGLITGTVVSLDHLSWRISR